MNAEQAKKLRAPFPAEQIGKLPKPTKKDNPKGRCNECGGWHGLPAVHLDYVGHAATTDRLLQVDPAWTWEPVAVGPNGEPLLANGGLWIKLTVCGVTRIGFGDSEGGKGPKEAIGDAIRNAAMRFGVALDLWAKEDLHAFNEDSGREPQAARPETPVTASAPAGGTNDAPEALSRPDGPTEAQCKLLNMLYGKLSGDDEQVKARLKEHAGGAPDGQWTEIIGALSKSGASDLIAQLKEFEAAGAVPESIPF